MAKNSSIKALAVCMPCISLYSRSRKREAVCCFFLQLTLIGWIPASIWAYSSISEEIKQRRIDKVLRSVRQYTVLPSRLTGSTSFEKNDIAEMQN